MRSKPKPLEEEIGFLEIEECFISAERKTTNYICSREKSKSGKKDDYT